MSLEVLRTIVAANPDVPDGSLQRVRAVDLLNACDEVPMEKIDKKLKDIRIGPANFIREQPNDEKREVCIVIVPISSMRHVLKLAGG